MQQQRDLFLRADLEAQASAAGDDAALEEQLRHERFAALILLAARR